MSEPRTRSYGSCPTCQRTYVREQGFRVCADCGTDLPYWRLRRAVVEAKPRVHPRVKVWRLDRVAEDAAIPSPRRPDRRPNSSRQRERPSAGGPPDAMLWHAKRQAPAAQVAHEEETLVAVPAVAPNELGMSWDALLDELEGALPLAVETPEDADEYDAFDAIDDVDDLDIEDALQASGLARVRTGRLAGILFMGAALGAVFFTAIH